MALIESSRPVFNAARPGTGSGMPRCRSHRRGVTDHQSVTKAVKEIKGACDELEKAVSKRKIWGTTRRLFSFAQKCIGPKVALARSAQAAVPSCRLVIAR